MAKISTVTVKGITYKLVGSGGDDPIIEGTLTDLQTFTAKDGTIWNAQSPNIEDTYFVDTNKNILYRFSGTQFTALGSGLALGETDNTAYAGNKGKANAEAIKTINTNLDTKVDKIKQQYMLYGTNGLGDQTEVQYNQEPIGGGVAQRTSDGRVKTTTPTEDNDSVNLKYFKEKAGVPIFNIGANKKITLAQYEELAKSKQGILIDENQYTYYFKIGDTNNEQYFGKLDYTTTSPKVVVFKITKDSLTISEETSRYFVDTLLTKNNKLTLGLSNSGNTTVGDSIDFKTIGGQSIFGTGDINGTPVFDIAANTTISQELFNKISNSDFMCIMRYNANFYMKTRVDRTAQVNKVVFYNINSNYDNKKTAEVLTITPDLKVKLEKIELGGATLEQATETTLGGVKVKPATTEQTDFIGIDENGLLKTKPSGGGGVEKIWEGLKNFENRGSNTYLFDYFEGTNQALFQKYRIIYLAFSILRNSSGLSAADIYVPFLRTNEANFYYTTAIWHTFMGFQFQMLSLQNTQFGVYLDERILYFDYNTGASSLKKFKSGQLRGIYGIK